MRYVVTGGYGFIGSTLVEKLMQRGHKVAVVDNLSTGSLQNIPEELRPWVKHKGEFSFQDGMFDGIFHLGMPSSSPMYREDRHKMTEAIDITVRVFEYARRNNIPVIYASSSSLYNGLPPPHSEDMYILATDYYSEVRLFIERFAAVCSSMHGVRSVGLRLFSVYGKNERFKGPYANTLTQFFNQMKEGIAPVIYGDGTQTRDFTHVSDVVEAFLKAMKHRKTGVFNVGTGTETSFNETVGMLNDHLGTCIVPKHVENPIKNYVRRTCADTTKASRRLDFKARMVLAAGINSTYEI